MQSSERGVFILMMVFSAGFAGAAGMDYFHKQAQLNAQRTAAIKSMQISVPPEEVIGRHPTYRNAANCPYTLVEFGDYQCPPCHAADAQLKTLLPQYKNKVRFAFRNLPLTSIHAYAMPAAIVGETAREQGKFWAVHDALYRSPEIHYGEIQQIVADQHLTGVSLDSNQKTLAKADIEADRRDADKFELDSTPSFLLCCPDGKVLHLQTLDQLQDFVR